MATTSSRLSRLNEVAKEVRTKGYVRTFLSTTESNLPMTLSSLVVKDCLGNAQSGAAMRWVMPTSPIRPCMTRVLLGFLWKARGGIAQDHEIPGVVACHPEVSKWAQRQSRVVHHIGLRIRQPSGERNSAHVEAVGGLPDAGAAQDTTDHVAKALDLRPAAVAWERIGPGSLHGRLARRRQGATSDAVQLHH